MEAIADPTYTIQRSRERPEARRPVGECHHKLWECWPWPSGDPECSVCSHVTSKPWTTVLNWFLSFWLCIFSYYVCLGLLGAQTSLWSALLQKKKPTREEMEAATLSRLEATVSFSTICFSATKRTASHLCPFMSLSPPPICSRVSTAPGIRRVNTWSHFRDCPDCGDDTKLNGK